MKRFLLLISILVLVLLPIGCMDIQGTIKGAVEGMLEKQTSTYTIKVGGTAGLSFLGKYVVVTGAFDPENYVAFSSDSTRVEGQVPQEYTVPDAISVAGVFVMQTFGGTLEVELWKDGNLIDSSVTTDPVGVVSVMA